MDKENIKRNTAELFKDYPWNGHAAMRKELEAWLRKTTKYSSNRAMQTILNNAIAEGVLYKSLKTRRYHPSKHIPTP